LDRQHPRDLFDVALLLDDSAIISDLMAGFTLMLLSHNRPPDDLLAPVKTDIVAHLASHGWLEGSSDRQRQTQTLPSKRIS
jgi:hypothetical protein